MNSPLGYQLETMQAQDLAQVVELGLLTPEIQDSAQPDFFSLETLRDWLKSPTDPLYVARQAEQVKGFVIGSFHPLARIGYIYDLVIAPEARGLGLGSALLYLALERFQQQAAREIWCLVHEQNQLASQLFERYGLKKGRRFDLHIWLAAKG